MWFAGKVAAQVDPIAHQRVTDDPRGKSKFALQLLAGAIAMLPHQPKWKMSIVASSQDAATFGGDLTSALKGSHTLRFRQREITRIEVEILTVVEEGIGAIATASSQVDIKGTTVLFDFGNGTLITSVFQGGKLVSRDYSSRGVESLIDAIATHADTRRKLATPGNRDLIRTGIENRLFDYGNIDRTGFNFQEIYEAEIKNWVVSGLAKLLKSGSDWMAQADAVIAIGGGAQLPKITPLLVAKGIVPLQDSHWCNARGLAKLAQLKQRRGA